MKSSLTSDPAAPPPTAPALPPDEATLALLREWRASGRSVDALQASHEVALALARSLGRQLDAAVDRRSDADAAAARALIAAGPVVDGMWRYSGCDLGGLLTVIRKPVQPVEGEDEVGDAGGDRPPIGTHSAVAVYEEDGFPD